MGRFECGNSVARNGLANAVCSGIALSLLLSDGALPAADKPAAPSPPPPAKPVREGRDPAELQALKKWQEQFQNISLGTPPLSGGEFNPDTGGVAMPPLSLLPDEIRMRLNTTWSLGAPPRAPLAFNPDPPFPPTRAPLCHEVHRMDAQWGRIPRAPKPPAQFNPDPGVRNEPAPKAEPFFRVEPAPPLREASCLNLAAARHAKAKGSTGNQGHVGAT